MNDSVVNRDLLSLRNYLGLMGLMALMAVSYGISEVKTDCIVLCFINYVIMQTLS